MSDEKAILKRLRAGDMAAFDTIYKEYCKRLYSFSFSILKNHDQSEELVQDAFVTLWEKREQINTDLQFENYIFTFCYNAILKFFRKRKVENNFKNYLLEHSPVSVPETYNTIIYNEMLDMVNCTIQQMPQKRQIVFKLSRQEGKRIKEIAENLNISSRTVESHLNKALKYMKQEMEKASLFSSLFFYFFFD